MSRYCFLFSISSQLHSPGYLEDDFPPQLPLKLPTVGMVLENGYPYFSLHAEREWASQFYPPTEGFVDLGPNNRTFVVSMIHQMHCLEAFRVGFIKNGTAAAHHVEHCLRYMRQTVLCNADLTLEPAHPVVREGKWTHGASGVGSVHRCRDWTALRRYVEAHPAHEVLGPEVDNTPSSR